MVKREIMKLENLQPEELVKKSGNKSKSKRFKPGCRGFYVTTSDPRLPHPRQLISRNYDILAKSEKAKALFPKSYLVASSRRLPNLGEILSPTLQQSKFTHPIPGQDAISRPANEREGYRG